MLARKPGATLWHAFADDLDILVQVRVADLCPRQ